LFADHADETAYDLPELAGQGRRQNQTFIFWYDGNLKNRNDVRNYDERVREKFKAREKCQTVTSETA
jgi:hypothetical protein